MALGGILVVSLEQAVAAPLCTQRLADAGARVIKVERPEGDFARGYDAAAKGESSYFAWLNHGKESLVLDIKRDGDAALLAAIIARADVFVQNLAPGAAARAGFGSEALRVRHPRLITCDISGYGNDGPSRDMKAYDLLIQCETGLASITGSPDAPGRVGVSVADIACGMNAAAAIFEALYTREVTGEGSAIAVSLFDSLAEWMAVPLLQFDYGDAPPSRVGLRHPSIAPYGVFPCRGGDPIVIAVQNEREWQVLCHEVLDRPDWVDSDAYRDNQRRVANRARLDEAIAAIFAKSDRSALADRLKSAGIAYGAVNSLEDLSSHPQLRRQTIAVANGEIALPAAPVRIDRAHRAQSRVPALGEHNASIRSEFA